jgi:hypothetical protein
LRAPTQERLADKEARVQAARERNRLKTQDAAKKRQLDKLRQEQNSSVDDGEVRIVLQFFKLWKFACVHVCVMCILMPGLVQQNCTIV